jgi:hypothetical protein
MTPETIIFETITSRELRERKSSNLTAVAATVDAIIEALRGAGFAIVRKDDGRGLHG